MSWATDIKNKKKTNTQGQALDRFSFDELFNRQGVSGQSGGNVSATASNTTKPPEATSPPATINYGNGIGLIPGTAAYAEWQKSQNAAPTSGSSSGTPDGGPTTEPVPPAASGNYMINIGGNQREFDKTKVDSILAGLQADTRAKVQGMIDSGQVGDIRSLFSSGIPLDKLIQLQQAAVGGRNGNFKVQFQNGRPQGNGGYGSYEPKWMAKRRERNAAQYAPEPAAPYVPNMPGHITEDKLPPGYTPINGTYDPQTGQPMVSQAVGPDGSVWGVGADGMPMRIRDGGQQSNQSTTYPAMNPNGIGNVAYPGQPGMAQYYPMPQQLPPEMMQMLMSQLPYFNMYMQGMTPY